MQRLASGQSQHLPDGVCPRLEGGVQDALGQHGIAVWLADPGGAEERHRAAGELHHLLPETVALWPVDPARVAGDDDHHRGAPRDLYPRKVRRLQNGVRLALPLEVVATCGGAVPGVDVKQRPLVE